MPLIVDLWPPTPAPSKPPAAISSPFCREAILQPSLSRSGLTRARIQWYIKLDGYALWRVGDHRDATVELSEQALDYLEAQAHPGLVDVEIRRKTDAPVRHLHMQVGAAPLPRYPDFAGSIGVGMLRGIRDDLVDQEAQRNRLVG